MIRFFYIFNWNKQITIDSIEEEEDEEQIDLGENAFSLNKHKKPAVKKKRFQIDDQYNHTLNKTCSNTTENQPNEKKNDYFKRQINNLICDLEDQQKQIEKNFQSGYSAQEEGYKGRVLGIQVLRKNIKPFYCCQPCFENAEQVKHNKEDLEEIKQFYNSSKQKSVLEKYSLILTKGQLDIVFNCLENQFSILESSQNLEPTKKSIDKPPLGLTSQIQNNQSICQDVASLEKAQTAQMGFSCPQSSQISFSNQINNQLDKRQQPNFNQHSCNEIQCQKPSLNYNKPKNCFYTNSQSSEANQIKENQLKVQEVNQMLKYKQRAPNEIGLATQKYQAIQNLNFQSSAAYEQKQQSTLNLISQSSAGKTQEVPSQQSNQFKPQQQDQLMNLNKQTIIDKIGANSQKLQIFFKNINN
ncbi:hypothetical protein ABPG72_017790 [Tetrahymena utriculariae]